ncbi:MAG: type 4a pilus biogenesis protein PilO [Solirubrobacterales bacterium]|nr:type 4a pilus biogenesis protein PilO [Solirubrobacterales bacterium]
MKSANRVIVAMLAVAVLGAAFWVLALGPKREEANKLGTQVEELKASLAQHRQEAANAAAARREFPFDYQQLVVLGKAVPGDDDTASLLVQVNRIANHAEVEFRDIELDAAAGEAAAAPAPTPAPSGGSTATPASTAVTPTEVTPTEAAASMLPLGAAIGPAGLGVMPYTLIFDGSFSRIADLIKGLDALVETEDAQVAVDGRLVTVDGFSLAADPKRGFPALEATFAVTTYLTPPNQGVTAGATPASPATATPASTTIGATP